MDIQTAESHADGSRDGSGTGAKGLRTVFKKKTEDTRTGARLNTTDTVSVDITCPAALVAWQLATFAG